MPAKMQMPIYYPPMVMEKVSSIPIFGLEDCPFFMRTKIETKNGKTYYTLTTIRERVEKNTVNYNQLPSFGEKEYGPDH